MLGDLGIVIQCRSHPTVQITVIEFSMRDTADGQVKIDHRPAVTPSAYFECLVHRSCSLLIEAL